MYGESSQPLAAAGDAGGGACVQTTIRGAQP